MPKRRQDSEDDSEGETLLDTDDEDSYDSDDDSAGSLEDFIAGEDEPLVIAPKAKTKKGNNEHNSRSSI
jgi:hypothetical protein